MRTLFALLLLASAASAALAHEGGEPPVTVTGREVADAPRPLQPAGQTLPMKAARRLRFDTDRGTWMSLDVTPDGKTILFDMLGDLYAMPAGGGRATALSNGLPFDTQPTVSPDGRHIVFVSDRSGADNLWIADLDGRNSRQISFGDDDTVLTSPAWAADGKAIFVSRYRPDLNNYELWRYGLDGQGKLIVPIRDTAAAPHGSWRSSLGAAPSRDGRYLYFAQHVGGLAFEDLDDWSIMRRDLATGEDETIVTEQDARRKADHPLSAFRPMPSPDGRLLAYARRTSGQTELRLLDLTTGIDRRLAFPVEHDQLQSAMWQDILPRFAFTPDGQAILISVRGEMRRIAIADGTAVPIAFEAAVDLAVGPSTRQDIREESGPVRARLIMAPVASPDGRTLAFSALGRLYLMPLDGTARPRRFAIEGDPAFQPSWSPDGRTLLWIRWSERNGGAIWSAPVDGSATPRRLSDVPAYYSYPVFSPDGRRIYAIRSSQQARLDTFMEYGKLREAELVDLPAEGGAAHVVTRGMMGGRPQFAAGTLHLFTDAGLRAVDPASGALGPAIQVKGPGWYFQDGAVPVDDMRISPDGKWLLAQVAQQLHLVAAPAAGTTIDLSDPHLPHRRITQGGADYFEWSADGRTIGWSSGSTFHARPLASISLAPAGAPSWVADAETDETRYVAPIELPRAAVAPGRLLLSGGRLLTMAGGDRVIDRADILIEDGRFAKVGPAGSFPVPPGTPVRDMTGKTILPGFIDTHDHVSTIRRDVLGLDDWGIGARLAYGVTTSFDPSTLTIDMLAYQDMLDAGLMVGPRIRQTGVALFSMQRFTSLDEAMAVIGRYRDDYGLRNIKEYRTGSRKVRQWVAEACARLGMQPTTEGALSMKLDLTQILDGFAGNEHALVAAPLQKDVLELLRFARTSYTTTLEITNGGPPGQDWSISSDDPHDDGKILHFWPRRFADQLLLSREWRVIGEYRFPAIAADAAALQASGGLVGIGSHGETPGIGFHYEMEAHAKGGMAPMAVLHAATIGSAETIGRKSDLGSVEPGKRADLVILTADPLIDVRNARAVAAVMRDGRLYDAATLDEIWPMLRVAPPGWFARDDAIAQTLPR
ncbi:amidohydrolase family protein [Flavisphingomonas formosensis]|uniref:amidohydrolase family protein n=1 Tax=Flavisphingomonas formosensis TaxID=861534 RepID=UPI0012F945A4|nr:amidohydrolase family protein [Sphingomonas formosensis]